MALRMQWSDWRARLFGSREESRAPMLNVLRHRYVREKQHAMRYRQHAERIRYPQFRDMLLGLAGEEEKHAESIGAKIRDLGEKLPNVVPILLTLPKNRTAGFTCERILRKSSAALGS